MDDNEPKVNRSPFVEMREFKDAVRALVNSMEEDPMSIRYAGPQEFAAAKKALESAEKWLISELFPANQCMPYNVTRKI